MKKILIVFLIPVYSRRKMDLLREKSLPFTMKSLRKIPAFEDASSILVTISSVIQIIVGVKGLKACKVPETAGKCVTWGIVIAVLSIISMVIGLIGGGDFNITNLAFNLLVPGLYVYGALKTKPNVNG